MDSAPFLTGKLLLAMPGIGDPRFEKSVIAMCSHDKEGALGIGIGHVLEGLSLHGLLKQFDIETDGLADRALCHGGPVEPKRGFVLHSLDWGGQGTIVADGRWGLSGSIDALRVIGRSGGPSKWTIALGYAGWGAGQLDGEMKRHGWHLADASDALLFDVPVNDRWQGAFQSTGIDPKMLASESGHA